jgi:hypothetical protein
MRTIAENYNGKVLAVANQGFSIKNASKRIEKSIEVLGFSTEKEIAKTGSTYITVFGLDDLSIVTIRVSNHGKRGHDEFSTFNYTTDRFGAIVLESVEILNTEMLNEFLSNYKTIFN